MKYKIFAYMYHEIIDEFETDSLDEARKWWRERWKKEEDFGRAFCEWEVDGVSQSISDILKLEGENRGERMNEEPKFISDTFNEMQKRKLRRYEFDNSERYQKLLKEFRRTRSIRTAVDIADFDIAYDDKVKEIARDKISENK